MALHTTTTAPKAAANGGLAGFQVSCSCGFTFTTAFAVTAAADAAEHVAYMATKGRKAQTRKAA